MDSNQILIRLQAILDREKSKNNINKSIERLQNQIRKLELQTEIDPSDLLKLKEEIEKIINQEITISNINFDENSTVRQAQDTGEIIGQTISSSAGLGKLGALLKDQLSQAAESFKDWVSVNSIVTALISKLQTIPDEVIAVNSAMMEKYI